MKKSTAAGRTPVPAQAPLANAVPTEPARNAAAGWDPYEVWRTRVLLPRVEDAAAAPRAVETNVKPLLRSA